MPQIPEGLFLKAVKQLVRIDKDWIPSGDGSLYLRPFMYANEPLLGVCAAEDYVFCVIASPVGAYFKGGAKAVSLWGETGYARAASGGTGAAKCIGNYAASLAAQAGASSRGCDQVVFLDAAEHKWVEELGGMNAFFAMSDGSLVTPPLGGTILPGITRASIITRAEERDLRVEERPYSFDEWRQDAASGKLVEAFACGTAAVLAGIGLVRHADGAFMVSDGETGKFTTELRQQLIGIQTGLIEDKRNWTRWIGS